MQKNNWKKKVIPIVILIILITVGVVFAGQVGNGGDGFRINHSTYSQVWAHAVCEQVNNTDTTTDYFVPTRTTTEWNAFNSKKPSSVTIATCNTSNLRISNWSGWVNMYTNGSGVWVNDPDCVSGSSLPFLTQCQKQWPEAYSYIYYADEYIYGWKAANCEAGYNENWSKPTYTCRLCSDISSSVPCYSAGCLWHDYGTPVCRLHACSYYIGSDCVDAGCFWSDSSVCKDYPICSDWVDQTSCELDTCQWDDYNYCCWEVATDDCRFYYSFSECLAMSCEWDPNESECHTPCP